MRLSNEQFKRFRLLAMKVKQKKATPEEQKEFADLQAMKDKPESNDLSWWANYPELLRDSTKFPFNWIPGTGVGITGLQNANSTLNLGLVAIAHLQQAVGRSTSDANAFNSQIRQLWLDMHRKYRGIGTYQKADLGMAIIAIHNVFIAIAKFERIYGIINTYHIGNRVVPRGLKEALGISNDLEENLADFRYTINLYIEKCRQLCLPKGLSMLMADVIAESNLFKDSKDRRAFIFGFDTETFGKFDGSIVNTGGSALGSAVVYKPCSMYMTGTTPDGSRPAYTLADIQNVLEDLVSSLLNDDDINTMCSDLIAAYGTDNVMTLVSLDEDYKVEPVEDYERSLQFHNLTIVGPVASIYNVGIVDATLAAAFLSNSEYVVLYQENNTVQCRLGKGHGSYYSSSGFLYPTFATSGNTEHPKFGELLFDTWVEEPGDTEIMCGTRYCAIGEVITTAGTGNSKQELISFGSMVVTNVQSFVYTTSTQLYNTHYYTGTCVEVNTFKAQYRWYSAMLQMDWAPIFYIVDQSDVDLFGDIDNFTHISAANLTRLHEVALLSGYKIPMVSKE